MPINRRSRNQNVRFAETLLPLLDPNPERAVELANEAISGFTSRFQEHWLAGMRDKLETMPAMKKAISTSPKPFSERCMKTPRTSLELFRRLCEAAADEKADANVRSLFANPAAYDSWASRWRSRLTAEEARTRRTRSGNESC